MRPQTLRLLIPFGVLAAAAAAPWWSTSAQGDVPDPADAAPSPRSPGVTSAISARFPADEAAHLAQIALHLRLGDPHGALQAATEAAPSLSPAGAAVAWVVAGSTQRDLGDLDAAADALREAAALDSALKRWSLTSLAEVELVRDAPVAALDAAERAIAEAVGSPADAQTAEAWAVRALAHARLGHEAEARAAAATFRGIYPQEDLGEAITVELARHELAQPGGEAQALPRLTALVASFRSPTDGEAAEALLRAWSEAHPSAPDAWPDDTVSLQRRAQSLRDGGRLDEAWAVFRRLQARADALTPEGAPADPALVAWISTSFQDFAYRTRRWDELERAHVATWAQAPTVATAWEAYRAAARGGRWPEARSWIARSREALLPGEADPFAAHAELVARALLFAGDAGGAAPWIDLVGQARTTSDRATLLRALARRQAGDDAAAWALLQTIPPAGPEGLAAAYWSARCMERTDPTGAQAALAQVRATDPTSWYGLLAQGDVLALDDRDGRFPAAPATSPGGWRGPSLAVAFHTPAPWDDLPSALGAPAWSSMGAAGLWRPVALPLLPPALLRAPAGYPAGSLFHPEIAQRTLDDLAARADDAELTAIADLAAAGHDALTGPLFAGWYDRLRARANRGDRRAAELARSLPPDAWREVFAHVRDHHHVARVTWAAATDPRRGDDLADRRAIEQLAWPIAHGHQVWRAAAPVDLDPYLALSIMRAESTYNANAVSRVGARGPMQIMPRTGHLLAARMGVPRFSARDLHDPDVAVAFGVRYLGLLSDRFDGVWPLAVAAYNAGPHNVAAWRAGVGEGAPIDLFVELIPFTETRDYVKKVASFYATYLRLYQPDAEVAVPDHVGADHPEIVDF